MHESLRMPVISAQYTKVFPQVCGSIVIYAKEKYEEVHFVPQIVYRDMLPMGGDMARTDDTLLAF